MSRYPNGLFTGILGVPSGGTGASSASGTSLDNITGFSSTGVLVRTGAGTYAFRTLTGTTNVINITNGTGVSGDPTFTVGSLVVRTDTAATMTVGYKVTPFSAGTKSSGTYTPLYSDGNFQTAVNGGAHTLAPPADDCTMILQYTNNGSAGAITTSGFTKVDGSFTTANGDDFFCNIIKVGSFSYLSIVKLQ